MEQNIKNIYNTKIQEEIEDYAKIIVNNINEMLTQNGKDDLFMKASIYKHDPIPLFKTSYRVKTQESMIEKIYRKDIDFKCKNIIDINGLYCYIDDIIGIKVIATCSTEIELINDILKSHINEIKDFNINLQKKELNNNNHEVYKHKFVYKGIPGELQIDSVMPNTWNELEHNLFYKDYNFSYVKNNNKELMIKIGDIVQKIDVLISEVKNQEINHLKKDIIEDMTRKQKIYEIVETKYNGQSNYNQICVGFIEYLVKNKSENIFDDFKEHDFSQDVKLDELSLISMMINNSSKLIYLYKWYLYFMGKEDDIISQKEFLKSYLSYYIYNVSKNNNNILLEYYEKQFPNEFVENLEKSKNNNIKLNDIIFTDFIDICVYHALSYDNDGSGNDYNLYVMQVILSMDDESSLKSLFNKNKNIHNIFTENCSKYTDFNKKGEKLKNIMKKACEKINQFTEDDDEF